MFYKKTSSNERVDAKKKIKEKDPEGCFWCVFPKSLQCFKEQLHNFKHYESRTNRTSIQIYTKDSEPSEKQ